MENYCKTKEQIIAELNLEDVKPEDINDDSPFSEKADWDWIQ